MTSYFVGGPAYNYQIDARSAMFACSIAMAAVKRNRPLNGMHYVHNSLLPAGRAQWLQAAKESGADYGITIDADVWIDDAYPDTGGDRLLAAIDLAFLEAPSTTALLGIVMPQRNGIPNCWYDESSRVKSQDGIQVWRSARQLGLTVQYIEDSVEEKKKIRLYSCVHAIGFGIAIYNLAWWNGKNPANYFGIVPTGNEMNFVGEDFWHSKVVRSQGGTIAAAWLPGVSHGGLYLPVNF